MSDSSGMVDASDTLVTWNWKCVRCGLHGSIQCPPTKNHLGALLLRVIKEHEDDKHEDIVVNTRLSRG